MRNTVRNWRDARIYVCLGTIFLILGCFTIQNSAQSALDGFDPNANGTVRATVVQSDGKILIGGDFTTLAPNGGAPVTRRHIARLNPDGTLDAGFNPNANNYVSTVAIQPDGKILVGGAFSGANSIGGQARNFIARLNVDGSADAFNPNADEEIDAIAVQTDGRILAGGFFTSIGGQNRNFIARLDANGAADAFNPNASDVVLAIAVQPDGKILVGGAFSGANSIGGQTRDFIARLNADGTADSFDPSANNVVFSIALQADGKVLAGGAFTAIGGQSRGFIGRLDAATGAADSFNPNANDDVRSIVVQTDGRILAGGFFTGIGGQNRDFIARLDANGAADALNANANSYIASIAVQSDGKILVGGDFSFFSTVAGASASRRRFARLETDGRLDQTLDINSVGGSVKAIALQADGRILIGGEFSSILGAQRNNIARLNTDGTLDIAFNPNADAAVNSIAVQSDGKILAGGSFANIGGQPRNFIARLDAATGAADSFNPSANNEINSIALQPDGKILVGGAFSGSNSIGGQTRNRIARLNADGTADSFDPNANDTVNTIVRQADGMILAGGKFTGIGGQSRNRIARLDVANGAADSFDPSANNVVFSIAVQADGKVLAGGAFTAIGGQSRGFIGRLDTTTGAADSFNPNANDTVYTMSLQSDSKILAGGSFTGIGNQSVNRITRLEPVAGVIDSNFNPNADGSAVFAVAVQTDGKVLVGGNFGNIGGQARSRFARLSNNTAALQNLSATQSVITWTRDGASPLIFRAAFEQSTDGVNYIPLASNASALNIDADSDGKKSEFVKMTESNNHTAVTVATWTITGLNLSRGQNIYIRARGFYRDGYQNGSESITETVRNVYFPTKPTYEADVSPRGDGNGAISSTDVSIIQGFQVGIGLPYQSNEFQRADCAPFSTRGDGRVTSIDVSQAQAYQLGFNLAAGGTLQPASGPTAPGGGSAAEFDNSGDFQPNQSPQSDAVQAPREVRVTPTSTGAGRTVVVPVAVDAAGDESVYGFSLSYDTNVLSNPVVTIGNAGGAVSSNTTQAGRIGVSVSFGGGTIAAGSNRVLISVSFTVANNAAAGTTPINLTDQPTVREVASAPGSANGVQALPTTFTSGNLTITMATTAAGANLGGRVVTSRGAGVAGVEVILSEAGGGERRTTVTDEAGNYRFANLAVGRDYIVTPSRARYDFTPNSKFVALTEELTETNFTAISQKRVR